MHQNGALGTHHQSQSKSNGFSALLIYFRSTALSEHLLSKHQALNWSHVSLENPLFGAITSLHLPHLTDERPREAEGRAQGHSADPGFRARSDPKPHPFSQHDVYILLEDSRGWKPGAANSRKCWKAGPGLFFNYEWGPRLCKAGPAWLSSRGRGSQGRTTFTFTGDAVGEQLVAHKAGADDLLPRVSALLFAGPAAWSQSKCERRPGAPRRPPGFFQVFGRGQRKRPQGRLTQKGRLPRLEPTAAFTAPSLPMGDAPGTAASGPSPDLTDRGVCGAPIPHFHRHCLSSGRPLTWLSEHPWYHPSNHASCRAASVMLKEQIPWGQNLYQAKIPGNRILTAAQGLQGPAHFSSLFLSPCTPPPGPPVPSCCGSTSPRSHCHKPPANVISLANPSSPIANQLSPPPGRPSHAPQRGLRVFLGFSALPSAYPQPSVPSVTVHPPHHSVIKLAP